jgi:hypothetical protein
MLAMEEPYWIGVNSGNDRANRQLRRQVPVATPGMESRGQADVPSASCELSLVRPVSG